MQRVWRTVTGFYHVCARGTGKQLIFEGDEDRWEFLELMRECCRKAGVTVIAWCLMGNHVRLVLADYEDAMSAAMHRLLLTYARRFNKRTGRTGHLFQNRFDRRSLDTDWQVMEAIRSVHADSQEAGISLIERYPWSSFAEHLRAYDGDAADVARDFLILLACLSFLVLPRALLPIRFRRPTAAIQRCPFWKRRSGSGMPLPKSWRRGSGFRSTGLKPRRRRSAISSFLDCTMPVLRCVRLSDIRGLAKVPFLVSCVPVHERRCRLAETWRRTACAPQLGSPICHNHCSKSLVR